MWKRRRSLIWSFLLLLLFTAGLLTGLYALLRMPPEFYPPANRETTADSEIAAEVFTQYGDLRNDILYSPEWTTTFEVDRLNAFLREHFGRGGSLESTLGKKLSRPRLAIQGDRLILAATYQACPIERWASESTTTVVSLELKMWVVPKLPCTLAIEVCSLKAGMVPIGSQRYLDALSEAALENNIEVNWYRKDGHPVGVFRFYANQPRPNRIFGGLTIADGKLTLSGKNLADAPVADGPPAAN